MNSLEMSGRRARRKSDRLDDDKERVIYRNLAREHTQMALVSVGSREEQCIKIKAALLLVKLHEEDREKMEEYFYSAVEIARRYIGEDFYNTPYGEEVIQIYLSLISPDFQSRFLDSNIASFLPLIRVIIRAESERRIQEKPKKVQDLCVYFENIS